MSSEDHDLLVKLIKGSADAFEKKQYVRYKRTAVSFCLTLLKGRLGNGRVVRDVFSQFWEKRERFSADTQFKSYFFISLHNQTFDYLKGLKRDEPAVENLRQNIAQHQAGGEDFHQKRLKAHYATIIRKLEEVMG